MGYTLVKSFERGIDTRKLIDTTEPGSLLEGRDCHITLGGELEKRAAFVIVDTLPAGTIGLWVTQGRVFHTWGDAATAPAGLPPGAVYHSIPEPAHTDPASAGTPLAHILSVEEFNGALYVVAEYEDGHIVHWWKDNFVAIPAATEVPGGGTPPDTTPGGKPQTLVRFVPTTFGGGPPPTNDVHIYAIWLISPTTTYNFSGPTPDAFMLIDSTGTFPDGRPSADIVVTDGFTGGGVDVAAAVMNAVNAHVGAAGDPDVSAQADTYNVNFWINVVGTQYNGWKLEFRLGFCIPSGPGMKFPFSGGIDPVGPGSLRAVPAPRAGLAGDPIQKGNFAIAHNYRMFSVQGTLLNYSATRDPAEWQDVSLRAGFIDHSMITNRAPFLMSMADYGGDLAVFGLRHIFIWHIEPGNPEGDFKRQTLHGTGTFAPHSATPWGQSDVMYLDTSGIRSLRARDSSEQTFSADIGTLIDELVRAKLAALTAGEKVHNIWGNVEPRSGRLWMALKDRIYVLSFYPTSRISAWTWYDAATAPVDMMNSSDDSVYWRSGDNIICYGGEAGTTYDDTEALARIPYIDAGKPATSKNWTGIDAAVYGTWQIRGSFDPTVPAALDLLANVTKSTYAQQKIAMNGESPAVSLELKTVFVGPARVGNASLHYTDSTAD